MIDQQESTEYYQVFLSNKLCKQIQIAIFDQSKPLEPSEHPVHLDLLKSICLSSQDVQFIDKLTRYYQKDSHSHSQFRSPASVSVA